MAIVKDVRKEPLLINPTLLIIYGPPKMGKTQIVSQLSDNYHLSLEIGGDDYITGRIDRIKTPGEFENRLKEFHEEKEKIATYLIVDTITQLDEWSELVGTIEYMQKTQGKKFNREDNGAIISPKDKRFESIHSIGQGYGYVHSRDVMMRWLYDLHSLVEEGKFNHVILLSHIKDKLVEAKNNTDLVEAADLSLTGKLRWLYASKVSAIAFMTARKNQRFLSFENEYKITSGGRCPHLNGNILISEKMPDKTIKTYWDDIFLK